MDDELMLALKKYGAREYSKGYYAGSMKRWRELEEKIKQLESENETLMNNQIALMNGRELEPLDETARRH